MRKYLYIFKTTLNDSLQYVSSLIFRFFGFILTLGVIISLWFYIYSDGSSLINGYSFNEMIWYLILSEIIVFGSGSKVATDEVRLVIKNGDIAYHVNKPYQYIIYVICKYFADTLIRFIAFLIIGLGLGYVSTGTFIHIGWDSLYLIPVFLIAVLITGMVRILISLSCFWIEDSRPFQQVYGKIILMFGVMFPLEMFPNLVQAIIRYSPIYGVSYGPAKLAINFSYGLLGEVLLSQFVILIVVSLLLAIVYRKGVRKLNVNGG